MVKNATKRRKDQATSRDRQGAVVRTLASRSLTVAARKTPLFPPSLLRPGYSFPEVMFAVVVLGIGFIMLAAIFPVAVKQTKATADETRAMGIGRSAVGTITGLAMGSDAPDTDFYAWAFNQDRTMPPSNPGNPPTYYTPPARTTYDKLPLQVGNSLFPATGIDVPAVDVTGITPTGPQPWFNWPTQYLPQGTPAPTAFPGRVFPVYTLKGWEALRGNLINVNDTRYAWTFLYRRDGNPNYPPSTWSPVMQVYIIVANVRSRTNFDMTPDGPDIGQFWTKWSGQEPPASSVSTANLSPRYVQVNVTNDYQNATQPSDGPGPDLLTLNDGQNPAGDGAMTEGCYVIMQDTNSQNTTATVPRQPGKVYQLGPSVGKDQWQLVPGKDLQNSNEDTGTGKWEGAWILGRERDYASNDANHTGNPAPTFKGPAQDVYLYTAVVPIGRN